MTRSHFMGAKLRNINCPNRDKGTKSFPYGGHLIHAFYALLAKKSHSVDIDRHHMHSITI